MPDDEADTVLVVFDGDLTIRTVDAVRGKFMAALPPSSSGRPARIAVDCSAAGEIDLTFIQLLIAARHSAGAAGTAIGLVRCPDGALLDVLTRGGFRVVPEPGGPGCWFAGEAT